jgi:hypothetical protein
MSLSQITSTPWKPRSISEVADIAVRRAEKLQQALAPSIGRRNDAVLTNAEIWRLGVDDYRAVFGHAISERHFRRLFDRTIKRHDLLGVEWSDLSLYLDERPALKPEFASPFSDVLDADFRTLRACMARFNNLLYPSHEEKAALWHEAFQVFEALLSQGKRNAKAKLVSFIWAQARFLAPNAQSPDALRRNFENRFDRWIKSERKASSMLDGRAEKRGSSKRPQPLTQSDKDIIVRHTARNYGGRVRQALRELGKMGEASGLSRECLDIITAKHGSKSYLNRRVIEAVKYDARLVRPYFLGHKHVIEATASLRRDYTKLRTLDVVNSDDLTGDVYFSVPDGKGWFDVMRGQILIWIDCRSLKVIAWKLIPSRVYTGLDVKEGQNEICINLGVPGTWYFERGTWEGNLAKSTPPPGWQLGPSLEDAKTGWEKMGVRMIHAHEARSKPVEHVLEMLQRLMEPLPGYCGRDERRDCPERTKRAVADVRARRKTPSEAALFTFDGYSSALSRLIDNYNAEPQQGEILDGLSPNEAFDKFWPCDDPPKKLDNWAMLWCAPYEREMLVTEEGVSFTLGKESFCYRNINSSDLRGRRVWIHFDPVHADYLIVTNPYRKNPRLLPRSNKVDFLAAVAPRDSAEARRYQEETRKASEHSHYPKARYTVVKSAVELPTRKIAFIDGESKQLAIDVERQREEHKAAETLRRQVDRLAGRLNIQGDLPATDETKQRLERMLARREMEVTV